MVRNVLTMMRGRFTDVKFAVIGSTMFEGRPLLSVFISQPLIDAGFNASKLVKDAARLIQGGGGGTPFMATAGGKNPDGLKGACEQIVAQLIGK